MHDLPDFESVVKMYEPLIKKFLSKYHLVFDYEEYRQIALIALWEAYTHYDPKKGPFPAFASATVRGRLLTEMKKRRKYEDIHETTDKVQDLAHTKQSEELQQVEMNWNFAQLSKREKDWLEKAIIQDLSTKEIAAYYQVTQDTVRSWKKGAIKKLRRQCNRT